MEQGSGYSCKFPPSQNPACTLLAGAFPIEGSAETSRNNKSIFWLLEWLSEFRGFLPKSCYLLESSSVVSSLLFGNRIQH